MAASFSSLTANGNNSAAATYSTANLTFNTNAVIIASVITRQAANDPSIPTCTGANFNWVQQRTTIFDTTPADRRLTVFAALANANVSSPITFNFANSQTDAVWAVSSVNGVVASGTVSTAIPQSNVNQNTAATTTLPVLLAAFNSNANGTYGVFGASLGGENMTAGPGMTSLAQFSGVNSSIMHESASSAVTTVRGNINSAVEMGGVALELASLRLADIAGTATTGIPENNIVAGGKTVIATLTGDVYVPLSSTNIVFVGSQTAGFAGTTTNQNIAFSLANGIANAPALGDIVIVTYAVGALADRTLSIRNNNATVEYTLMNELYQNDTFDINLRSAYRFMIGGTAEAQFVLGSDLGGTGNAASAGTYSVHVFRGVDSATPMDVTVVNNGAINGHNVKAAAITPVTNGAFIYASGGGAMSAGAIYTSSDLNSFVSCRINDTQDAVVGGGYIAWNNNGAFTPIGWGGGGTNCTSDSWASVTVSLRPNINTPFNDARQAFIDGMDSAQSESGGWDAEVRAALAVGNVARTDDTTVTVTLPAVAAYDITANETITVTVPASILVDNVNIVGDPTFAISTDGAAPSITYAQLEHALLRGAFRGIILGAR